MRQIATLSEAIREGAKLAPQVCGFGMVARGATCALGAALHALTGMLPFDSSHGYDVIESTYPYANAADPNLRCPACNMTVPRLLMGVYHLNDAHRWTRERIADFVEQYEEKLGYVHLVEQEVTTNGSPSALYKQEALSGEKGSRSRAALYSEC